MGDRERLNELLHNIKHVTHYVERPPMDWYQELRGSIGKIINGISVAIDLVDKCNLACPSCSVGMYGNSRPKATMSISDFKRIMEKILQAEKVRYVQFFVYSDSLLHPQLPEAVAWCRMRGIKTCVGTTLQTIKCDLQALLDARPDEIRVGFSGFTRPHVYQRGFKLKRFFENVDLLKSSRIADETRLTLFFHSYRDNVQDTEHVKAWAKNNGFDFIYIPAIFQSLEKIVYKGYTEQDKETISWLHETPEQALARVKKSGYCPLIKKWLNITATGKVYLCNNMYPEDYVVGNIYQDEIKTLQERIAKHPFCAECKACGTNVYQMCYVNPILEQQPVQKSYRRFIERRPWDQ